ncbi:MAG: indolepyruvate oxidoreductase subunit beta [Deltaproteobacteria bacterium]|jgi:indolepyruvate ferredoxin oxidoreductase beta subunit|nr:MAG: indolepyruvate oxidoreductase subunit beta [Deltaproteobacteria bacterium]
MKKDILIAGVGGQGSLFATNVLCQYALERGLNVLGTETIGAAQRGGSVVSHMRISDQPIYSPLVPPGRGDVLLGMESIEFLRNIKILARNGYYILNLYSLPTVYTNLGIDRYPSEDEIVAAVKEACEKGYIIPATVKAAELGNTQMTNVVMLGVLGKVDDFFEYSEVKKIVEKISPKKFLKENLMAYEAGRELV